MADTPAVGFRYHRRCRGWTPRGTSGAYRGCRAGVRSKDIGRYAMNIKTIGIILCSAFSVGLVAETAVSVWELTSEKGVDIHTTIELALAWLVVLAVFVHAIIKGFLTSPWRHSDTGSDDFVSDPESDDSEDDSGDDFVSDSEETTEETPETPEEPSEETPIEEPNETPEEPSDETPEETPVEEPPRPEPPTEEVDENANGFH